MELKYIIKDEKNISEICKDKLHISSRLFTKIKKNNIYLNNKFLSSYTPLKAGDILKIDLGYDEEQDNIVPNENIKFKILYEDEWMLIVDKGPNMPVHPTMRHYEDSLSNGIKSYFNSIGIKKKIRIVNRLDKDTSGIVIIAKCEYIQERLIQEKYEKYYYALATGKISNPLTIDKPIARKQGSIIEREINAQGDNAVTEVKPLKIHENFTEIECHLLTGRTHQIRVHLASIGHPLLGDTLYGRPSNMISRQALHAYKVILTHPITQEELIIKSNIPEDIKNASLNS